MNATHGLRTLAGPERAQVWRVMAEIADVFLGICGGPILRAKNANPAYGGLDGYARYGLRGSYYASQCWAEAKAEASRGCKPGRVNWTVAKTKQEAKEKVIKARLKSAMRAALAEAGLPQPTRITLVNSAHHDYLGVTDHGHPFVNVSAIAGVRF